MFLTNLLIKEENQRLELLKARVKFTKTHIKHEQDSLIKDAKYFATTPKGLLSSFAAGSLVSIATEKKKSDKSTGYHDANSPQKIASNESSGNKSKNNLLSSIPWTTLLAGLLRL